MDSILYHSIFTSIQGEGATTGRASVFLRLAGCNLDCVFCDTKYAVEKKYSETWIKEKYRNIIKKIVQYAKNKEINNLIITGGEPLLQISELIKLIESLPAQIKTVEIETNGTVSGKPLFLKSVFFNISPKLANSGEPKNKRIIYPILKEFNNYENSIFKFVVKDEKDMKEILNIKEKVNIKNSKIYLMPMAKNQSELEKQAKDIIFLSLKNGFNFSDRLHIRYSIE